MLIVSNFDEAWNLIDPRKGRRSNAEFVAFLECIAGFEVFPYYREGIWVGDGRRDARLDLEAIAPDMPADRFAEVVSALGSGEEGAIQRLKQVISQG